MNGTTLCRNMSTGLRTAAVGEGQRIRAGEQLQTVIRKESIFEGNHQVILPGPRMQPPVPPPPPPASQRDGSSTHKCRRRCAKTSPTAGAQTSPSCRARHAMVLYENIQRPVDLHIAPILPSHPPPVAELTGVSSAAPPLPLMQRRACPQAAAAAPFPPAPQWLRNTRWHLSCPGCCRAAAAAPVPPAAP